MTPLRRQSDRAPPAGARRARRARAGLTLAEVLVAAALMAVLLMAIAVAMHAAFTAYAENRKIAEVTQVSRVVLQRMMKEVRTAQAVTCSADSITLVPPANGDGLTEIEYALEGGVLYYRQTVNGEEDSQPLIQPNSGVVIEDFTITRETGEMMVEGETVIYTERLTVQLQLRVGSNDFPVTASVCPRRNLTF